MSEAARNKARQLRCAAYWACAFALLLWVTKLLEYLLGLDLAQFGIYPRKGPGFIGIIWAPLIHGSWAHLMANTGPVILLGTALLYGYPKSTKYLLPVLYAGVGIIVWLFAREAYHIGASGLTFGLMLFIFTIGLLRRDKQAMVLSLIVMVLYGGMFGGLLSDDPAISFESHLAGAGLGILLAILLKDLDPPPPPKKYSWEEEEDSLEDFDGHWQQDEHSTSEGNRTIH